MLAALVVALAGILPEVDFAEALNLAGATGRLEAIDFTFDPSTPYTFWSGLIGGLFLSLAYFGCDQSQVQRFLTAKSVDQGRTSLLVSAFFKIPVQFMILLIGVLVFVFYQFQQPPMIFNSVEARAAASKNAAGYSELENRYHEAHAERSRAAAKAGYVEANKRFTEIRKEASNFVKKTNNNDSFNDVNYVFPMFIIRNMPMGIIGLLIAAIFAAAMSSISSELNALATASTIDFYKRHFRKDGTDRDYVMFGRFATFVWGVFACIVAIYATNLGSLIEVVNKFGSYFYGSLLGVFILAIVIKRARARGAFFGLLIGMASVEIASNYTDIEFLWFNVVGAVVTVAAGYLISLTTE
jgi:SSS family solute:Na+ symporter